MGSCRPRAEPRLRKLTPEIGSPEKPDLRIEIGADEEMLELKTVAVGVVVESGEVAGIVAADPRRASAGDIRY